MEPSYETLLLITAIIAGLAVYLAPIGAIWYFARHSEEIMHPEYPEWIYGMDDGVRYGLLKLGVAASVFFALSGLFNLFNSPLSYAFGAFGLAGTLAFGRSLSAMVKRRRAFEQTYREGVPVDARYLEAKEDSLRPTIGTGGGGMADEAMAARGAAMIMRGQWLAKIGFTIDDATHRFERRISSQAHYRHSASGQLPILVRPEDPEAWIPRLGAVRAAEKSLPSNLSPEPITE